MKNFGGYLLASSRTAGVAMRGRLSLALGVCGVAFATGGGCLPAPRLKENTESAGQDATGGTGDSSDTAGLGGGGMQAGAGMAGKKGTTKSSGGTGGTHSHPSSGGTGGAAHGGTGGGTAAGGGAGTDASGGSGADTSNDAGGASGASGEAGSEAAGAPSSTGGSGGAPAVGGSAGTSSAGTSSGGMGGNNDVEEPFDGPCPGSVMNGWATVADYDFDPAAGTVSAPEVVVTDAATLLSYAASPDPYVIRISGTIATPVVDVSSNKVIMGDDTSATLQGGFRILGTSTDPSGMLSNIVIKNLHIDATTADTSTLANEDDGIMIAYAHHVWVDHVDIWDAGGDDMSISNGADYITVSWSKFYFVNAPRRAATRIGNSDTNAAEDAGRLRVSLHHNWWHDSVDQRMPRVRFGQVHAFNNYYSNRNTTYPDNTYCIAAGYEAELLVENNFFDEAYNPHVFFSFSSSGVSSFTEPTAQMVANGNTYIGVSDLEGGKLSGQGPAFTPPYSVTLDPADDVLRNTIRHCAGNL
jgi:pectate lyase